MHSVPSLSLEPEFSRSHGSLYKSLAKGRIEEEALRELLVAHAPKDWPLVFAVDASTWARCDAECSPERGFHYSASHHSAGQPIVAGWSYQWISQLNWAKDSWTAPADVMRISPAMDATTTTIDQVKRLCGRLPANREVPLFAFDAGYDPVAITDGLRDTRCEVLVRISSSRVFHPNQAPRDLGAAADGPLATGSASCSPTKRAGRRPTTNSSSPTRAMERFAFGPGEDCTQSSTVGGAGRGRASRRLSAAPSSTSTSSTSQSPRAAPTRHCGCGGRGPARPISNGAARLLAKVRHRTFVQIRKGDPPAGRRPSSVRPPKPTGGPGSSSPRIPNSDWPAASSPTSSSPGSDHAKPAKLTPCAVRRGFRRLRATVGTPALPPKSRTPGPGRPKGTGKPPRTRYPAVKKAA